ncbi:toll-like receptor 5 [Myxocyprinus asiaticus]|uniref:toll-like receptor 5 n=1 Tax=Myxocyprinus asiaticus TaxID=70543 RepID=UPI00222283EA|nr:toll-like receptor 5 [Myxocyprinus asiaticus]
MEYTLLRTVLGLCILTQVVKCNSVCSINSYSAVCIDRGLHQVPELPTYVNTVDLSLNNIAELNETSFSRLEGLQVLRMEQQTPGLLIRNNTFRRLNNLISLQLGYNHMLQLEKGAFNGLFNLQILSLTQCSLDDSILSGDFLKPLVSLEVLVLRDNKIERIRPAPLFLNMRSFHILDLSRLNVKSICEEDLLNFQGKQFTLLKLSSVRLREMNEYWSGWDKCGNPFKNMSITILDLSGNGFAVNMAQRFFDAIRGTKIQSLILSNSYSMGSSFGHKNLKNPDKFTFKGLEESGIKIFDLSQSNIITLSNSLFNMSDLEELTLAHNQITEVENNAFLGLTNLLKLNLSQNYLGDIDSETFLNLQKLELLDLSYNNIKVLGDKSFQGLENLLNLNLTGNDLTSVHELATLPNLEKLYLGDNRITSLSNLPNVAKNLTTLDLEMNKLNALSDLYTILREFPQIEKIFLQGNMFWNCYTPKQTVLSDKIQLLHLGISTMQLIWSQGKCLDVFNNLHLLEQLSLYANGLQSLPKDIFKDLTSLHFLDLSFNSLKYISNGTFPKSLRILNLDYNSIYSVDPNVFSTLTYISLLRNQFRCDCNLRDFQTWLNQTNVILAHPIEDVTCASPEDQYMVPVLTSNIQCEDDVEEKTTEKLRLVLFICCATLIILLTTSAIVYVRSRGYFFKLYKQLITKLVDGKREDPEPDQFLYDVYLCFSSNDMKWVERALLKRLDSQFSKQNVLHCCFEERDFIPGEDHLSNMRNAIQSSRKTLCVVSEHFLKDGWCLETFTLANNRMEDDLKDILVVLVVGNIPQYRLLKYKQVRSYIENRRYLLWPDDSQDLEWFYDQLLHIIRKDTKVKQTNTELKGKEIETKPEAVNVHANTTV